MTRGTMTWVSNSEACTIDQPASGVPISVMTFAVEWHPSCSYDYLTVNGARYCGSSSPEGVVPDGTPIQCGLGTPLPAVVAAVAAVAAGTADHLLGDHLLRRVVCKRSCLEPQLLRWHHAQRRRTIHQVTPRACHWRWRSAMLMRPSGKISTRPLRRRIRCRCRPGVDLFLRVAKTARGTADLFWARKSAKI